MEKGFHGTAGKVRLFAILAFFAVIVSAGAARIMFGGEMGARYGRGFHSWAAPWQGAPWQGRAFLEKLQRMTEEQRAAFFENRNLSRPTITRWMGMLRERGPAAVIPFALFTLGVLALGICGLYWIDKTAKTVNSLCGEDGKTTAGALKFLPLAVITFGIYALLWLYMLADRLQDNAPKHRLAFKEGGPAVLLWFTLGTLIFAGPFVALYIIYKNVNALSLTAAKSN